MIENCKKHGLTEHRQEKNGPRPEYKRCLKCQSINNKKKHLKRNILKCKLIENRGAECENCGYNESPEILQWHHINPSEKSFEISRATSSIGPKQSITEIEKETEKCLLLCPNCHCKIHTKYSYKEIMEMVYALSV